MLGRTSKLFHFHVVPDDLNTTTLSPRNSTSVLMAEVVALALAVTVAQELQRNQISFLSDNQQLV
jgi:hypothetical protein